MNEDNDFTINILSKCTETYCTRKRLKKMFKYFLNKKCNVSYEHNNSLGHHFIREKNIKYDNFEIIQVGDAFNVKLNYKEKLYLNKNSFYLGSFLDLENLNIAILGLLLFYN